MMIDDFKAISPELSIRNTITDLKNKLRMIQDEIDRYTRSYEANIKKLSDQKTEFVNSLDAWNKVLENFKNGGQSI